MTAERASRGNDDRGHGERRAHQCPGCGHHAVHERFTDRAAARVRSYFCRIVARIAYLMQINFAKCDGADSQSKSAELLDSLRLSRLKRSLISIHWGLLGPRLTPKRRRKSSMQRATSASGLSFLNSASYGKAKFECNF